MSNPYETLFKAFHARQAELSRVKQEELEEASKLRKRYLDPSYDQFNPDEWEALDFDTFYNPQTKERLRVSGGEGRTINSFEAEASRYQGDKDAENRFQYHRKAYARMYGKDPEDVSIEDLTNLGKIQSERMKQNKEKLRGIGFRRTGYDKYNRTLAEFEDMSPFEDAMGTSGNAAYFVPDNYKRRLQDMHTGDAKDLYKAERSWGEAGTDQLTNLAVGGGRMVNDLGQAISTILGAGEATKDFFEGNREALDRFKVNHVSEGQLDRERFAEKRGGLASEIFDIRKREFMKAGDSERTASVKAGLSAYRDHFMDLIEDPGRILDAAIESLPYMIGVGAVGRAVASAATKKLAAKTLTQLQKAGADKEQVAAYFLKYMNGKEAQSLINASATRAGIYTVGVTEGLSNSAEVYASTVGMTEEQASRSEKYQALRKEGKSHEEAVGELAKGVFWQTLISTTALAAAASAVTRAGAFEAGLFRFTKTAAKEGAKDATEGTIKAAATKVAQGTANIVNPGLKEFAEESIQSGGGAFLSQLAQYDQGLIDQVGPGVGEATAEGGLVGFASGSGAATITGGGKALLSKLGKGNKYTEAIPVKLRGENGGTPGGSLPTSQSTPDAFIKKFNEFTEKVESQGKNLKEIDASNFLELEKMYEDVQDKLPEDDKTYTRVVMRSLGQKFNIAVKEQADAVLAKDPEKWTKEDEEILVTAATRTNSNGDPLIDVDNVKGALGASLKKFVLADRIVDDIVKRAGSAEAVTAAAEATGTTGQSYLEVASLKLGDVQGPTGPGLARWSALLKEAISTDNQELWDHRIKVFTGRFLGSQRQKLAKFEAFMEDVKKVLEENLNEEDRAAALREVSENHSSKRNKLVYKQGSSELYLELLQEEQKQMEEFLGVMKQSYEIWQDWRAKKAAQQQEQEVRNEGQKQPTANDQQAGQKESRSEDTSANERPVENPAPREESRPAKEEVAEETVSVEEAVAKARKEIKKSKDVINHSMEAFHQALLDAGNVKAAEAFWAEATRLQEEAVAARQAEESEKENTQEIIEPKKQEQTANEEKVQEKEPAIEEEKPLEEQTTVQLRKKAAELNIKGRSTLNKASLIKAIKVKEALKKLPQVIQDLIEVVFDNNPILDKKATLSLKSNLLDAGITDPNALRWAFKNKDLPGLKNVKSEKNLRQLAAEQWIFKNEQANKRLDDLNSEELADAAASWHVALREMVKIREDDLFMNSHDVFFMEIMTDVFLKELLDSKRERPAVPIVNKHALKETYKHYLENPGFQGMAKHYKKLVTQYSLMSSTTVPSSGRGEWVVIPQTESDHPMYDTNVKKLQELSPSTWCTASWAAPDHVNFHENVLLIVNGKAVVGLELVEEKPRNKIQERIKYLEDIIELYTHNIKRTEEDILFYETGDNWYVRNGQAYAAAERVRHLKKVNKDDKEQLKQAQSDLAKKQEELKSYVPPPAKIKIIDSTRVANDGVSSVDFLDETLAYLDERGIDYSTSSPIQKAIALKEKGKTDKDSVTYEYDDAEYDQDEWVEYDPEAEEIAERERRQMQFEHTLQTYENVLNNLQSILEGTHIYTKFSFQEIVNKSIKAVRNVAKLRDPRERSQLWKEAYTSPGIIGPQMYDLTPMEYMVFTSDEWAELYENVREEFLQFQADGPEELGQGYRFSYLNISLATNQMLGKQIEELVGVKLDYDRHINAGGQGFNYSGYWLHALETILRSDNPDARNIAEDIFKNRISPLLYEPGSTIDDVILTEEGLYALATVAGSWYHALNPDVLRMDVKAPRDSSIFRSRIIGMTPYQVTPERVAWEPTYVDEPVHVTKEFLDIESRMMIPVNGDNSYGGYMHQQIFQIRDEFRRDEAARFIRGNGQIPAVIWDEAPFSLTNAGGIQGWSVGNSAVINAAYTSPERAPAIGLHEVAHLGINRVAEALGGKDELFVILKGAEAQLMEKAQQLIEEDGFSSLEEFVAAYGFDLQTQEGQLQLLIELTARWAEHFAHKPVESWWQELIEALGNWVRKFVGKELTKEEVDAMVAGFIRYGTERPGSKKFALGPTFETSAEAQAQPQAERSAEVANTEINKEITRTDSINSQFSEEEIASYQRHQEILRMLEHARQGLEEKFMTTEEVRGLLNRFGYQTTEDADVLASLNQAIAQEKQQIPDDYNPGVLDETVVKDLKSSTEALSKGEDIAARNTVEEAADILPDLIVDGEINPAVSEQRMRQLFELANVPYQPEKSYHLNRVKEVQDKIQKKLNSRRLPRRIGDALKRLSKNTRDLLAHVPNLMVLLNDRGYRDVFRRAAKLNVAEDFALGEFKAFQQELKKHLLEMMADVTSDFGVKYTDEILEDNPIQFLRDNLNNIDDNVLTAIALESMNWLSGVSLYNDERAMNALLGRNSGSYLSQNEQAMLRTKGSMRTVVYNQIGNKVLEHLNLAQIKDSPYDQEILDKMSVALGNAAIYSMQQAGYVTVHEIDRNWYRTHHENGSAFPEKGPMILTVSPTRNAEGGPTEQLATIRDAWRNGKRVFEDFFGVTSYGKWPQLDMPTEKQVPKRFGHIMTRVSQKLRDRIQRMQERPWIANLRGIDLVNRFIPEDLLAMSYEFDTNMDLIHAENQSARQARNESYLQELRDAAQWAEENGDSDFFFTYFVSQSGRTFIDSTTVNPQNSKIHRFLFGMKAWETSVVLPHGNMSRKEAKKFRLFLVAVAQGMGIDIDKLTQDKTVKKLQKELELDTNFIPRPNGRFQAALDVINGDGQMTQEDLQILEPFMKTGVHALVAMQAFSDYVQAYKNGDSSFVSSLPIETDGITNGFSLGMLQTPMTRGLTIIKDMLRATGIMFKDDPQSFAVWIGDPGARDNYQSVAFRTGQLLDFIRKGDAIQRDNDFRPEELQHRDSVIRQVADGYRLLNSNFLPSLEDMEGSDGRKWAKNPLMITAYGASLNGVIRAISTAAYEEFLGQLANTNRHTDEQTQKEEMLNLINQAFAFADAAVEGHIKAKTSGNQFDNWNPRPWTMEDLERVMNNSFEGNVRKMAREFAFHKVGNWKGFNFPAGEKLTPEGYTVNVPAKSYADLFKEAVEATYGEAMAIALQEKLRPLEELRRQLNSANKLMSMVFVEDFARRLNDYHERLGRPLTRDERKELYEQLFSEGMVPSIAMALSGDITEYMETTSYSNEVPENGSHVNIRLTGSFQLIDDVYDEITRETKTYPPQTNITAALLARLPNADVGVSALVKLIHALDGANNSSAWGEAWSVLNMHDAQVSGIHEVEEVVKAVNEDLFHLMAGYSLPGAMLNAMERFDPLLQDTDPRLSKEQKQKILEAFKEELMIRRIVDRKIGEKLSARQIYDDFLVKLRADVQDSNKARETLLDEITSVSQYSLEGFEFVKGETEYSFKNYSSILDREQEHRRQQVVNSLVGNYHHGNLENAVIDWLLADEPSFMTAWKILQATLTRIAETSNNPEYAATAERVRKLTSLVFNELAPKGNGMLPGLNTKVRIVDRLPGLLGKYTYPDDEIEISADRGDGSTHILSTLMHELIHATNANIIAKLENDASRGDEDAQKRLNDLADRLQANLDRLTEQNSTLENLKAIREIRRLLAKKEYGTAISEYISYVHADMKPGNARNSFVPVSVWANLGLDQENGIQEATQLLQDLLANEEAPGGLALYSGPRHVNNGLFAGKAQEQIEHRNLQGIFDRLNSLEQYSTNPAHRSQLQKLLDEILIPGLKSIDPLMYQFVTDPNSKAHAGAWSRAHNLVRIQAAGNRLTNNNEMSLQETLVHEILHAIAVAAFGDPSITDEMIKSAEPDVARELTKMRQGNVKLRKELVRIFEQVRDAKGADGQRLITWKTFMPETVIGSQSEAEAAAKARYDHIFHNGEKSLHEFFAIALTNYEFATALSQITNRDTRDPIWDKEGGILSSLMNLLDRIFNWITGQTLGTNKKSIHGNIYALAQRMVEFNENAALELDEKDPQKLLRNRMDEYITKMTDAAFESGPAARLEQRLRRKPEDRSEKPGLGETVQNLLHAALVRRTQYGKQVQEEFLRYAGMEKDHWTHRIASEVLSYNEEDKGTGPGSPGFIDLLGHSKYQVDLRRQRMIEHSRETLMENFDPNRRMTTAEKEALSIVMTTDLISILQYDPTIEDLKDLVDIMDKEDVRRQKLQEAIDDLYRLVVQDDLRHMFLNQASSLSSLMIHGRPTIKHTMQNVHNIVKQYNLDRRYQRKLVREDEVIAVMERITSLMAMGRVDMETRRTAGTVLRHELDREVTDNGFSMYLGMHHDFKELSKQILFENNPTQMIKGYTYEMLDEDINIEFVMDTPEEHARMKELGYVPINKDKFGPVPLAKDSLDNSTIDTVMYIGLHGGLGGYQKAIVSLTNMQKRGHNLMAPFKPGMSDNERKELSQEALKNLGDMRAKSFEHARKTQHKRDHVDKGTHSVPVLDDQGNIVDYRYLMTEETKRQHMKKRSEFNKLLPRMFGTIVDRQSTVDINRQVVDLLYEEAKKYRNNDPTNPHRFVEIGENVLKRNKKTGKLEIDEEARAMWRLLPDDMKRYINKKFGGDSFYIRDNAVNLVLGFRKLSIAGNKYTGKYLGKGAFIVRTGEKVWLEVMQLLRIKVALLTPEVVIGNMASNYALLLSEGIPVNYIRKMTGEAISSLRKYQKDVKRLDKVGRYIGIRESQGKNTHKLRMEYKRLESELAANPVHEMITEGMYTSIVEDLGNQDDTLRERGLNKLLDKFHSKIPGKIVKGVSEAYMLPGSSTFKAAQLATQYGDFIGRYIKYNYDIDVRGKTQYEAKHDALAAFIYYDMPQHAALQFANDYGFIMFTKFFARIQHVIANLFLHNPTKAAAVIAVQQALAPAMLQENIANYALMQGATRKFEPVPLMHLDRIEPWDPSLLMWLRMLGLGG